MFDIQDLDQNHLSVKRTTITILSHKQPYFHSQLSL
jgi:hypothetical protein